MSKFVFGPVLVQFWIQKRILHEKLHPVIGSDPVFIDFCKSDFLRDLVFPYWRGDTKRRNLSIVAVAVSRLVLVLVLVLVLALVLALLLVLVFVLVLSTADTDTGTGTGTGTVTGTGFCTGAKHC